MSELKEWLNPLIPAEDRVRIADGEIARLNADWQATFNAAAFHQEEAKTLRAQLAAAEARAERLQVALEWISRKLFVRSWTGTIGAPSSWRIAGDYRHTTQRMKGATLLEAVESAALAEGEAG